MKTNTKILILSLVLLSVFGFYATTQAAGDYLFVSPSESTIKAGAGINISVAVGTSGDKICAVQGTILFNNLTCKSITLASGVMAQTSPTCSDPSFIIGIPKCVTANTTLFTVSSNAEKPGIASISFSDVNLIGLGVSAGTTSLAGNYTVNAAAVETTPKTTQQITQPAQQIIGQVTTPTQQTNSTTTIPVNVGAAALANSGTSGWVNWFLIIVVILVIIYVIYCFAMGKKKGK